MSEHNQKTNIKRALSASSDSIKYEGPSLLEGYEEFINTKTKTKVSIKYVTGTKIRREKIMRRLSISR
jgi:hypothetical protein